MGFQNTYFVLGMIALTVTVISVFTLSSSRGSVPPSVEKAPAAHSEIN
ncbi:MFS transporter [Escherichia coli]